MPRVKGHGWRRKAGSNNGVFAAARDQRAADAAEAELAAVVEAIGELASPAKATDCAGRGGAAAQHVRAGGSPIRRSYPRRGRATPEASRSSACCARRPACSSRQETGGRGIFYTVHLATDLRQLRQGQDDQRALAVDLQRRLLPTKDDVEPGTPVTL